MLAGCGCLAIGGAAVLVAGLTLGTWWLRDQAIDLSDGLEGLVVRNHEIETWEQKANAHPYEPPQGGIVPEDRLLTFIGVRRQVHQVYVDYEPQLLQLLEQAEGRAPAPSASELLSLGVRATEMYDAVRLAQVKALAEGGMSDREYTAIRNAVYLAAGAARAEAEMGRLPAEAVSQATERLRATLRAALDRARREGLPGTGRVSDEELDRIDEALAQAGTEGRETLSVPVENVQLFRRHEAELEKYAMHGLAVLGL